jgi:predicted dehydrogenase
LSVSFLLVCPQKPAALVKNMKLRVGIVGLGDAWETHHRPALLGLADRFEVRAICAEVAVRAERAAREFDALALDGFRALLTREDVDAVMLLEPDWVGALPILAACDAGKAIYSTTALHTDPNQSASIKQRVESSGVSFMAEFSRRHAPATLRLKELIATKLGEPRLLFCHHRFGDEDRNGKLRRISHQQAVICDMMELVDWCSYMVERRPESVMGASHHLLARQAVPDYQMMSLDFLPSDHSSQGALAQISCGDYMPASWSEATNFRRPAGLQVRCERGVAFVDLPSRLTWFDESGQHMEALDHERPVTEQLLMHFHRSVTSLVRKTSGLDDVYQALNTVLSAKRSCEEGRRISLKELRRQA